MARGRIIDNTISNSRKVNSVSDQSALLFTWIQAHTDDFGRVEGGADDILFLVVPRRGWNEEQVEKYLKEMWTVGLVRSYHQDGKRYLEIVGFDEHQVFRSDRNRKAKYPVPTDYDTHWYTKGTQRVKKDAEVKLSKVKLSQDKVSEVNADGGKPPTTEHNQEAEIAKPLSPKEKAVQFFDGVEALKNKQEVPWLKEFLVAISTGNKVDKMAVWHEIKEFSRYWTELNPTGTKQRWQLQKTFEVERRLVTWFNRAGFKGFSAAVAKSGKGKNIIGLDEDTENE